ncbi:uncharacterized protein LOC110860451 [Folsomia candida]|uniref:DUF4246 domain-containing protein n=1 Tax=Folsomia candida TaxID=158441 RepID=A0A226D520_FOLCA|nr:uncharacterized protein LOC110860451 [Folsomia candida]OXA40655.1 hypothetical protein Fcan01_24601 [Folsomia candida]
MSSSSLPLERFYIHPHNTICRYFSRSFNVWRTRLSWMIRSRSGWEAGLNDSSTVSEWFQDAKNELLGDYVASIWGLKKTLAQVKKDWAVVISSLPHYLTLVDGKMYPGPLDGSWVADDLVDVALTQRLVEEGAEVEEIAIKEKNWQPGSENRVINVISPYLYCYLAERAGNVLKEPFIPKPQKDIYDYNHLLHFHSDKVDNYASSLDVRMATAAQMPPAEMTWPAREWDPYYQILPADVSIDSDGTSHFTSYVNGLNPSEHGDLYATLEQVLSKMIPLFEKTLTEIRVQRREVEQPRTRSEIAKQASLPPAVTLGGRKIQVVVRMATTILTPDNPRHPGGRWHIEGMANEQIVAIGLHYFSNENITKSKLRLAPTQRGWDGVTNAFEDGNNSFAIESVPGRSVVFKNSISHRVAPFELDDPKKSGHLRILAFFLVDPGTRILSTARVPCQQWTWYIAQVKDVLVNFLPPEMVELVVSFLPPGGDKYLDPEDAKCFQEQMRTERMARMTGDTY